MPTVMRDTVFDNAIDNWVRAALVRGARSFPELVRLLPGVYPAEAFLAIRRLHQELPTDWQVDGSVSVRPALNRWLVEHPLDFDWRFTPKTAQLLVDRCEPAGAVVCLGAPSLAREAAARGWQTGISLFDQNPALMAAIQGSLPWVTAVCTDLVWGEPVGIGEASVAVADAPWYPEHIRAFLWAASRLTRISGRVLVSLPAEGTRPGILPERETIFSDAVSFGLRLVSVEQGALAFWSPPFEKNALIAAAIPAVPEDWRRGDLAEFVVTDKTTAARPIPSGPRDEWDQEEVGIVRIKCRRCSDFDFHDPTLSSAVSGDILPTVSRRHPARAVADVWTCGNRVFRCKGPGVFRVIVSALGRGANVESEVAVAVGRGLSSVELELVQRATDQATALVRREKWELEHGKERRESELDGDV